MGENGSEEAKEEESDLETDPGSPKCTIDPCKEDIGEWDTSGGSSSERS